MMFGAPPGARVYTNMYIYIYRCTHTWRYVYTCVYCVVYVGIEKCIYEYLSTYPGTNRSFATRTYILKKWGFLIMRDLFNMPSEGPCNPHIIPT